MIKKTLALAIGLASAQLALAQGFYVDEQSALRLGDAFSGGAAQADDASTAFYNPAGLTRLKQKQLTINLSTISVKSEFDGTSSTLQEDANNVSGKDVSAEAFDVLPSIYFSAPMSDNFVFGAYLNAPYATGTDFGDDSVGRYFATESSITGIDFGTALGFKASENLSLGFSMVMQYLSATVAQSVNTSALCFGAEAQGDLGPFNCAGLGITSVGDTTYDSQFEMKGDDLNIGFTAGMLYEFSPESRLGLHYKNRISHNLQGNATLDVPAAAEGFGDLAGLTDTKAKGTATLETPSQANLSFYQGIGKFSLQADVQWTQWSSFDKLTVKSDNAVIQGVASPQTYGWVESYRYAIGGSYQLSPSLKLRTGFALDQTPIENKNTKLDFAFDDYKAISFGLTYDMNEDLALDFGLQKTLQQKRSIAQGNVADPSQNLSQLKGDVTTDVLSLAAGINMKF
jgi:long-chain fatty acid transport protein